MWIKEGGHRAADAVLLRPPAVVAAARIITARYKYSRKGCKNHTGREAGLVVFDRWRLFSQGI